MNSNNSLIKPVNPWTYDDEKEHFLSIVEWWCIESFIKTIEDNKKWSLKASIRKWCDKDLPESGTTFDFALLNQDTNKQYYYNAEDFVKKIVPAKDTFDIN